MFEPHQRNMEFETQIHGRKSVVSLELFPSALLKKSQIVQLTSVNFSKMSLYDFTSFIVLRGFGIIITSAVFHTVETSFNLNVSF